MYISFIHRIKVHAHVFHYRTCNSSFAYIIYILVHRNSDFADITCTYLLFRVIQVCIKKCIFSFIVIKMLHLYLSIVGNLCIINMYIHIINLFIVIQICSYKCICMCVNKNMSSKVK